MTVKSPRFTWPVTRERYRQVLLKMKRLSQRAKALEIENEMLRKAAYSAYGKTVVLETFTFEKNND